MKIVACEPIWARAPMLMRTQSTWLTTMVKRDPSVHTPAKERRTQRDTDESWEQHPEPKEPLDLRQRTTEDQAETNRPSSWRTERAWQDLRVKVISILNPNRRLQLPSTTPPPRQSPRENWETAGATSPLQLNTPRSQTIAHDLAHIEGEHDRWSSSKTRKLNPRRGSLRHRHLPTRVAGRRRKLRTHIVSLAEREKVNKERWFF